MAESGSKTPQIEDAPRLLRSAVCKYFGLPVKYENDKRVVDRTNTIRRYVGLPYVTGNITNMTYHLQPHHKEIDSHVAPKNLSSGQTTLQKYFATVARHG